MVNNKYILARRQVYETIHKAVQTGLTPKEIADELANSHRLEVTLHDMSKEMIHRMYYVLAEQCWYDINLNHYIGE
jgi:hypothetical protein